MDATYEGWVPDPFDAHEFRYFVDGLPTKLVKDGPVEAFDDLPPRFTWPESLRTPRPADPVVDHPTDPVVDHPAEPVIAHPGSPMMEQPASPMMEQPPPPPPMPPTGSSFWTPPPPPGVVGPQPPGDPAGFGPRHDDTFVGAVETAPSRRPKRRLVAGVAALVVVAAAASIIVVSGGKSAEAAVIDSVNSTMADGTANISMHLDVHAGATQVTGTGTGQIDFSQNAMQLQMTVGVGAQQVQMQVVYVAGSVYEEIPGISQVVPGKSWVSIDPASLGAASGQGASSVGTGNNPTAMLRILAQQGNTVVPLGTSSIDNTSVQGYLVTMDASAIKARLAQSKLPAWMTSALSNVDIKDTTIKVYVDGSGLLRRFELGLTESAVSTGSVVVDESLDFADYGASVNVSAPPPDQTVSFPQFLQAAGGAAGGSST